MLRDGFSRAKILGHLTGVLEDFMKTSFTTYVLWVVYLALLAVLLPHTAWAFGSMEPESSRITKWIAAIAFESAIAVLTHKLAKHIEATGKIKAPWKKFSERYLNPFALGLAMATLVSALANLAHAVEFGQPLQIFSQWGIPQEVYSVAFGGILPFVSLIFARVLSNVVESEDGPNPEVEEAKARIREANRKAAEAEQRAKVAEQQVKALQDETEAKARDVEAQARALVADAERRVQLAEERFGAAGDLMRMLFSDDKRQRILAIKQWRPQLSGNAIAVIAEASPAYVSEVLRESDVIDA